MSSPIMNSSRSPIIGLGTSIGSISIEPREAVNVAVRVRPDLEISQERPLEGSGNSIECITDHTVTANGRKYVFDQVFPPNSSQQDVYSHLERCVPSFIKGYNVSIMAYGQSGSGKSYSMGTTLSADPQSEGILQRASKQVFEAIEHIVPAPTVSVTYVEIYNEQIRDLLTDTSTAPAAASTGAKIPIIREDVRGNIYVQGIKEEVVNSAEDLLRILARGSLRRQTGSTAINSQSSRSHAICTLQLTQKQTHSETQIMTTLQSKLHFVDLAGSERLKNTRASDDGRLKEGISINSGLTSLGKVITQLSTMNPHISYRDSKLTRLLQDSLGGKAITYLIACVANERHYLGETLNTLSYAQRARSIQATPEIQRVQSREDMLNTIAQLQQEIQMWKSKATPSVMDLTLREEDSLSDGTLVEDLGSGTLSPRQESPTPLSTINARSSTAVPSSVNYKEQMLKSIAFQENVDRLIEGYEKTIDTLQSTLALYRSERDQLTEQLTESERQVSVLQSSVNDLRAYLEMLELKQNKMTATSQGSETTNKENGGDNDNNRTADSSSFKPSNQMNITLQLQKQVKALQAEKDSLRLAQKMYQNEVQHLTVQYNRVVREADGLRKHLQQLPFGPLGPFEDKDRTTSKDTDAVKSETTETVGPKNEAPEQGIQFQFGSSRRRRQSSFLMPAGATSKEWLQLHSQ